GAEGDAVGWAAGIDAGAVHGDSGAGGGARSGRADVHGFLRDGDSRPAEFLERSHRRETVRGEYQNLLRCASRGANGRAVRGRGRSPEAADVGGGRGASRDCVLAAGGGAGGRSTDRSWVAGTERDGRDANEYRDRG